MYKQINIESSYRDNDIGKVIYDTVMQYKPKKIVEFGSLYGYSTIAMAMALQDLNNGGHIISYDLWDDYQYKHSNISETQKNIDLYNVSDIVTLSYGEYNSWLDNPEEFDLLHLDISNTGPIIFKTFFKLLEHINNGAIIIFEGGSIERDHVEWMTKFNKIPITQFKNQVGYTLLTNKFPSLSIIKKNNLEIITEKFGILNR